MSSTYGTHDNGRRLRTPFCGGLHGGYVVLVAGALIALAVSEGGLQRLGLVDRRAFAESFVGLRTFGSKMGERLTEDEA